MQMDTTKEQVVALHPNLNGSISAFSRRFKTILDHNQIKSAWLDINNGIFWSELEAASYFIYRFSTFHSELQLASTIMPIIENHCKIKCFPDQKTCWHYDDKIKQYYLLRQEDVPVIDTWIFWNRSSAERFINEADLPLIFKLKSGASSTNVALIRDKNEGKRIIKRMFSSRGVKNRKMPLKGSLFWLKDLFTLYPLRHYLASIRGKLGAGGINPFWQIQRDYVLFQRFLPGNIYDTRVTVIGDRAFAFRRFNRNNDFRASGSGLIDYDIKQIDQRCIEVAFRTSDLFQFQCMAYDFLVDEDNQVKIVEISYTFLDTAVFKCPGYFDRDLKFHKNRMWPQHCILSDLMNVELAPPPDQLMLDPR